MSRAATKAITVCPPCFWARGRPSALSPRGRVPIPRGCARPAAEASRGDLRTRVRTPIRCSREAGRDGVRGRDVMKRRIVLGVLGAVGGLTLTGAAYQQRGQQGPKVAEIEKVKDNLYMLT